MIGVTGLVVMLTTAATGLSASAGVTDEATSRIIKGKPASQNYSWYVKLYNDGRFGCGGTLIAPEWVTTANHCITSVSSVKVGTTNINTGEEISVAQTFSAPDGRDFALIKLASPSKETPISVTTTPLEAGQKIRIIGHGATDPTGQGELPTTLQELDTQLEASGCTDNFDATKELCVGDATDRGACYGDSGGPLVLQVAGKWELGGATSRAGQGQQRCAEAPSIYMSVPAYADWIKQQMGT
jgi:secreted trypsin-like serine protease